MKQTVEFQIAGKWVKAEDVPVHNRRKGDRRSGDRRTGDRRRKGGW